MTTIATMLMGDYTVALLEQPPAPPERWGVTPPWFAPPASEQREVLIVAAGRQAYQYACALQDHPCCRPDPGTSFSGAHVVALEAGPCSVTPDSDSACPRAGLCERMVSALLVVFVVSDNGPWDAALAGIDPLLADVPDARLLMADLRHEGDLAADAPTRHGRIARGLAVGRHAPDTALRKNAQLDSVPAAILFALLQPGFFCIDHARYLDASAGGPAFAVAGFGRATGDEALYRALERAHADWRRHSADTDPPPGTTILVVGDPLDASASARILESTVDRFLADVGSAPDERRLVAAPILPPGATEVAFITRHARAMSPPPSPSTFG